MRVRFWGVRGSCPSPLSSGEYRRRLAQVLRLYDSRSDASGPLDEEALGRWIEALPPSLSQIVGSNTSCVELRPFASEESAGEEDEGPLFIMDMGSGLRALGNALMKQEFGRGQGRARLFLSHLHWDHIQGFPFFKPAYVPGNRLDIHARHSDLRSRLLQQQEAPFFPPASWECMLAEIGFHQMGSEPQEFDGVRVTTHELDHPSRSYAHRFERGGKVVVYASDGAYQSGGPSLHPFVRFFENADLLIFDAQFSASESAEKRSWGHSSALIGLELAQMANMKRLALFHHDPDANDEALELQLDAARRHAQASLSATPRPGHPVEVVIAREGQALDL